MEFVKYNCSENYPKTKLYVNTIMDLLPEGMVKETEKEIVEMLYNHFMSKADEDKRNEIEYISMAFSNKVKDKIRDGAKDEVLLMANYFYSYFIRNMIYDFVNRDKLFDVMNENIKVIVGFYSAYQSVCLNNSGEANIAVGNYR